MMRKQKWRVRGGPPSRTPRGVARRIASQLLLGAALSLVASVKITLGSADSPPALLFSRQCSSCHTIGKGDLVGPDLKGVTSRRDRPWLLRFIRSSQAVVQSGDPTASRLFERYKRQRMPDHDFTSAQIDGLLAYVSTAKVADDAETRSAENATPADVRLGFDLFVGNVKLSKSPQCGACHSIRHPWAGWPTTMTSFGPELSQVYEQYHDKPLAMFFRSPCWPREVEVPVMTPLTPAESFAIRAFLRDASRQSAAAPVDAVSFRGQARR